MSKKKVPIKKSAVKKKAVAKKAPAKKVTAKKKAPAKKKRASKKKKSEYYINPPEFRAAITDFYETGVFPNYLGECVIKIAEGLSYSPKFRNYSYIEDMVGDALIKMYAALKNKNFKIESPSNPFSYFTTIAFRAFINRIKKEKRRHETESSYREIVYEQHMIEANDGMVYVKGIEDEEQFYNG